MNPALLFFSSSTLVHLSPVDLVIIVFYFAMVLCIGFYLKGQANTGEDFFLAGREMTAWIAGLSFLSANLGSLELMGWAASAYQYGILADALVLDRRDSRHALPRHRDDAVLLHLQDALRPGLSASCASASRRARCPPISFAFMTVLMSGINMYSMAVVMKVVLGWDINFSIWVSSLTVGALCGAWAACAPPSSMRFCSSS